VSLIGTLGSCSRWILVEQSVALGLVLAIASWWTTPSWWSKTSSATLPSAYPGRATKKAMNEVSGPVIAVALVLCAVFVPTAFVSGITGQFYRQFALTIAFQP